MLIACHFPSAQQLSLTQRPRALPPLGPSAPSRGGRCSRLHQRKPSCRHRAMRNSVSAVGGFETGMSPQLRSAVDKMVNENKIVLFMKGTPQFPQCGFSNTCIQILNSLGTPYESVNILESDLLRQGMKEYSQWPTFPQCYIDGEFYGGCDIMIESYTNGELQEVVEAAVNS